MTESEKLEFDVVIVGAGPAGLSAAIKLAQLSGGRTSIAVLEKGSEIGAHILSGAVLEPRALNELIPDWKEKGAPLDTPAGEDVFALLTQKALIRLPTPPQMHNKGNYIISLGKLCRWLAAQAEALGVQVFPGFPAADVIQDESGRVVGITTREMGIAKDGTKKSSYQPAMEIYAKYVLIAEGCRGSLAESLMKKFALREGASPQTYGIGIKEVWEVNPTKHRPGSIMHTVGWPLDNSTYGGSFIYHMDGGKVSVGFVVGLDYKNPYLDPFQEMQRFKTHPAIKPLFEGARRISYGARALNEGGLQSIPQLIFPGGAIIGCSAGFLDVAKIKGIHNAMKSGMVAAESVFAALGSDAPPMLESYPENLRKSWVYQGLSHSRNLRPAFAKFGMWGGLLYSAIDTYLLRGRAPWTFRHHPDNESLHQKTASQKIEYPAPDGKITFDRMSSVFLSGTNHEEDQPVHLRLKDASVPIQTNLALYDAPEQRYCPAGVYEIVDERRSEATTSEQSERSLRGAKGAQPLSANDKKLQINAQNCVHCKTCDIKDPLQNIVWVVPEGGGGPNYGEM